MTIDSLIHLIRTYSKDIRMSFTLDECSWMISKRGSWRGYTTERQHGTCTRQLQILWGPTGKCQPQRGCKEVSHNHVPTKSKASPEESAKWEEKSLRHRHVCPTSHQIPCWYDNLAKGEKRSHRYQAKNTPYNGWMDGFSTQRQCALSRRREVGS